MAVGRGSLYRLDADIAARADAVLDHHRLLPQVGQALAHHARGEIGSATGGEGDDDAHGSTRPVGLCDEGSRRQPGDKQDGGTQPVRGSKRHANSRETDDDGKRSCHRSSGPCGMAPHARCRPPAGGRVAPRLHGRQPMILTARGADIDTPRDPGRTITRPDRGWQRAAMNPTRQARGHTLGSTSDASGRTRAARADRAGYGIARPAPGLANSTEVAGRGRRAAGTAR